MDIPLRRVGLRYWLLAPTLADAADADGGGGALRRLAPSAKVDALVKAIDGAAPAAGRRKRKAAAPRRRAVDVADPCGDPWEVKLV